MVDGTLYWWPLLGFVVVGFILLAVIDPFNKK